MIKSEPSCTNLCLIPKKSIPFFQCIPNGRGVKFLEKALEKGLSINAIDQHGYSALGYACLYLSHFPEFIEWLLRKGADPYVLGPNVPCIPFVTKYVLEKELLEVASETKKKRL